MSQFPLNLRALRDDSLFYHVLPWLPSWSPRPQLNLAAAALRCVTYNSYDGFLSHRGTPGYHPLIDWDFPWNKPSYNEGFPIVGTPHNHSLQNTAMIYAGAMEFGHQLVGTWRLGPDEEDAFTPTQGHSLKRKNSCCNLDPLDMKIGLENQLWVKSKSYTLVSWYIYKWILL